MKTVQKIALFFLAMVLDRDPPIHDTETDTDAFMLSLPAALSIAFAVVAIIQHSAWFALASLGFCSITVLERWVTAWKAKTLPPPDPRDSV